MNSVTSRIPDDEIDIKSIIRKVVSIIAYPFSLLLSNKVITIIFIIAAIGLAFLLKKSMHKTYSSYFIIKPLDYKEKTHFKILGDIQTLLKYKDYKTIAQELKIDTAMSQKLLGLHVSNPAGKNAVDSSNIAEVKITTLDYNLFIPFQNALLNYLETNPYFFKIKELQSRQIEMEMAQLEQDLVQLDSLKAIQLRTFGNYSFSDQKSAFPLLKLVDPTNLFTAETERVAKKSSLLARSKFLDNFQLIKSCVVIRQATFPPRVLVFCLYLVPAFLVLCVVFLHIKAQRARKKIAVEN